MTVDPYVFYGEDAKWAAALAEKHAREITLVKRRCPVCQSGPGEPCRTPGFLFRISYHFDRIIGYWSP